MGSTKRSFLDPSVKVVHIILPYEMIEQPSKGLPKPWSRWRRRESSKMKRYKIQSLASLEREMRAVARGGHDLTIGARPRD